MFFIFFWVGGCSFSVLIQTHVLPPLPPPIICLLLIAGQWLVKNEIGQVRVFNVHTQSTLRCDPGARCSSDGGRGHLTRNNEGPPNHCCFWDSFWLEAPWTLRSPGHCPPCPPACYAPDTIPRQRGIIRVNHMRGDNFLTAYEVPRH